MGQVKAGDSIHAGLELPGNGSVLAQLRLAVKDREGGFEFKEG